MEEHRLVTLVGPGGAGKTRLAVELASRLQGDSDNPVLFVDLSSLTTAEMVGSQVAAAAGISEKSSRPPIEQIIEKLPEGPWLLVLDNCEHVAVEAASLTELLLSRRADVSVLATGRQPLGVAGEVAWPVPPLPFPDAVPGDPEALAGFDAIRLFVERAALKRPGYKLTALAAPAVGDICRQLDGMPLAIELAAAWVGVLGEAEILQRLAGDSRLLESRSAGMPQRHRSMAAAVDGSYRLLEPGERRVFCRLSVFAGGFTLEAAEAVTGDPETLQALSALVSQSLLTADTDPRAPTRYRMLGTIRTFARERLTEDAESFEVNRRHAEYFLGLAEQSEADRHTLESARWVGRLTEIRDDLRAALEWTDTHSPDQAVRLAGALGWYWQSVATNEGTAWFARVLAKRTTEDRFRARAEDWAGWLAIRGHDFDLAERHIHQSYRISRSIGDRVGVARALTGLGPMALFRTGDLEAARRMEEEALELAREAGDPRITGGALTSLGGLHIREGETERAVILLSESIEVHRRTGNLLGMGMASVFLGAALSSRGEDAQAYEALEEALGHFERVGDGAGMGMTLELMAVTGAHLNLDDRIRISAAGQATLDREEAGRPPFWDYQAWRHEHKERLGPRWDRAWEQGKAMNLQRAIQIARGIAAPAAEPEGWEKLSRREREVAALVAEGLTNRDIASRLFISERTAESHVGSILTRLGFSSRSQIAAWAARRS
jgi:non-specific serine/threonine protein kinase